MDRESETGGWKQRGTTDLWRDKATHSDEHEHDGHDEVSEEGEPEDLRITLRRLSTAV